MLVISDPVHVAGNLSTRLVYAEPTMTATRLYTLSTNATADALYVASNFDWPSTSHYGAARRARTLLWPISSLRAI